MIIKHFEIDKVDLLKNCFFLFYGENEGLKEDIIINKFEKKFKDSIYKYDENEILNNIDNFYLSISTKSFFEDKKLIIISRVTEKIKDIIEDILEKKIKDLVIILQSSSLDKKSKLRILFEKNKNLVCTPFYEDNHSALSAIASNFFRINKIPISTQAINLLVDRSRCDRKNLNNELKKLESFLYTKKTITIDDIVKLTNLSENYNISELVDNCLAKNEKKTVKILNENNFSTEDAIVVIRTFLSKSKRLLKLCQEYQNKNNIDATIASIKPPIFWKDKDIIKQQMQKWTENSVNNLIYKISDVELLIKKNSVNSINIMSNFIIEQTSDFNN